MDTDRHKHTLQLLQSRGACSVQFLIRVPPPGLGLFDTIREQAKQAAASTQMNPAAVS